MGKTHFKPDITGMKKLGISVDNDLGVLLSECGFEPWERDDGLHLDQSLDPDLSYNRYLRENGYSGENLWHTVANSAEGVGVKSYRDGQCVMFNTLLEWTKNTRKPLL